MEYNRMSVDEMIAFSTDMCITTLENEIEAKIIDGVYGVAQKFELNFNEAQIKRLLFLFKPMQKELKVYKKAIELLAEDSSNTYLNEDKQDLIDYYLQKAREVINNEI